MTRWARFAVRRRWSVLITSVLVVVIAGAWGLGVFGQLSQTTIIDPGSESAGVIDKVADLQTGTPDIVAIYTAPEGASLESIGPRVQAVLDAFQQEVRPEAVMSYWTASPLVKPKLVSTDGTRGLVTIKLGPNTGITLATFADRLSKLEVPGVDSKFSGGAVVEVAFSTRLEKDLVRAELIAIPITLILLVVIFGGLVAAAVPVLVGVLSVLGALAVLRVLTAVTQVSSFSINVASLLGLGLAIDYGLFIVSRFREEMRAGKAPGDAAVRTILMAGRTVMFSALLLVFAFSGMLIFPQAVIRSLGLGAMAAVVCAAALSLTAVPAVLAILGPRINAITWSRTASDRAEERAHRLWGAVVTTVMKRPGIVATLITAALLLLAAPLFSAQLGQASYTALPTDDPARIASETITSDFTGTGDASVMVLEGAGARPDGTEINAITSAARAIPGVATVDFIGAKDDYVVLQATYTDGANRDSTNAVVRGLRDLSPPDGTTLNVGGTAALLLDSNTAIIAGLPWMIAIMVLSTLVLLFLAFGSVVLPIKAVLMAALSLSATFGLLTLIFQLGYGAGLLAVTPAPLESTFVVLLLAVVFGLSTDYEVFLMSRMVEARAQGASTEESVLIGAQRTGRIVTAAALILIIVTGAFTASGLSIMRFLGVGMITALIIDATVIRMLLVPSLVKLMGEANWWAPAWMGRLHRKVGIGH